MTGAGAAMLKLVAPKGRLVVGRRGAGGGAAGVDVSSSPQDGVVVLTGRGTDGILGGGGGLRIFASSSLAGVYAAPFQ